MTNFVLLKRKGAKFWQAAIPIKKGVSSTKARSLISKNLKKGFVSRIVTASQFNRVIKNISQAVKSKIKSRRKTKRRKVTTRSKTKRRTVKRKSKRMSRSKPRKRTRVRRTRRRRR